jgi:hypothetical protein
MQSRLSQNADVTMTFVISLLKTAIAQPCAFYSPSGSSFNDMGIFATGIQHIGWAYHVSR